MSETKKDRDDRLAKFDEKLTLALEEANLTGAVSKCEDSDTVKKIRGADFILPAPKSLYLSVVETKDSIIVTQDEKTITSYPK